MKDETRIWMHYAQENLQSAKVLLENHLYNPCLQNIQQGVEKALKALIIEFSVYFTKTHSIIMLKNELTTKGLDVDLSDDECDFLDSIYLPSKYPINSVLPDFYPDKELCNHHLKAAEDFFNSLRKLLQSETGSL